MAATFTGQCQCGEVRYQVMGTPLTLYACHCTECQRQSSSAFGMALWVQDPQLTLHQGVLREWVRHTPSGQQMACRFCPTCGTRLFHQILQQPDILSIKPGTLDDTHSLKLAGHIWTDSRQAWMNVDDGGLQYPRNPPDFSALIQAWQGMHP